MFLVVLTTLIPFGLLRRLFVWLQERFSEAIPEPVEDESKTTELAKLEEEVVKNRKKMKSMMAMMEAQNKLLRSLALKIDPTFELPEVTEEHGWKTDGADETDSRNLTAVDGGKEDEMPTDKASADVTREKKS